MQSTVIRDYIYDPQSHALSINFVSGRCYVYADVPPETVAAFSRAPSRGSFFNRYIRDHYAYRDITDPWRRG